MLAASSSSGFRRKAVLGLTLAFAVGAIAGGGYLLLRDRGQDAQGREDGGPGFRDPAAIFDSSVPLMVNGTKTSLEAAASQVEFPMYQPSSNGLPSPEAWVADGSNSVALRYGDFLIVEETPWSVDRDPLETYKTQAADWGGYATELNGHPAWVDPPNKEASTPFSGVHMYVNGVEVTLWSLNPLPDLIDLAKTVSQVQSA